MRSSFLGYLEKKYTSNNLCTMKAKCRDSLTHKRTTVKSSRSDRNRFSSSPKQRKAVPSYFWCMWISNKWTLAWYLQGMSWVELPGKSATTTSWRDEPFQPSQSEEHIYHCIVVYRIYLIHSNASNRTRPSFIEIGTLTCTASSLPY